jgi:CBS domain-containing protein
MSIQDIMTPNPACCTPDTPLQEVARMMVRCDCGEIPVVQDQSQKNVIGVVTDRDIVCRAVAEAKNPLTLNASAVMSSPAITVTPETDLDDVVRLMEERQIRRVPVVDRNGALRGIVSLADVARHHSKRETGELVREVSAPAAH